MTHKQLRFLKKALKQAILAMTELVVAIDEILKEE